MPEKPPFVRGEVLSAASALLLVLAMFALKWYGVDGIPGRTSKLSWSENAWQGLPLVRWVMLLTIAAAIGSVVLHASQRSHGAKTNTSLTVTSLGTLTAALLVYRVLIALPSADQVVDQKLGALLGMMSAFGIAIGGYQSMRASRVRERRIVKRRPQPENALERRPSGR
jgi:hypothetical protein